MKKYIFHTLILFAALTLAACSSDDGESQQKIPIERKQNPYIVNQGKGTSGNTNQNATGVNELDSRLEIPRIIGGEDHYVLIYNVDKYGVNYVIEWDNGKRAQRWTAYQMYAGNSGKSWNRNNWTSTEWGGDPFQIDPYLPKDVRTELSDYQGSGYTRGHIIPSADRLNSKDANEQTYYLSNMHPQKWAFNGAPGVWGNMENFLRANWNQNDFRDVLYVVKGGTIRDDQIKEFKGKLLVPQYFFMAAVCKKGNTYKGIGFWADHDTPQLSTTTAQSNQLKNCMITIDELETKTGIDFFCNLPDNTENIIESELDRSFWKVQ